MRTRIALPLLVACLLLPGSASAGTAGIATEGSQSFVFYRGDVFYEVNDLTVTREGDSVVFHDAVALVAVERCEQVDEHTARCTPPPGASVVLGAVWAGNRKDRVVNVNVPEIGIDGGPGNDTLSRDVAGNGLNGGSGDDVLTGSSGDDFLGGGPGKDRLYGREGDDRLVGGSSGSSPAGSADVIDGGPGVDVAIYRTKTAGVRIDLRRSAGQGPRGEDDVMFGIEGVETGGGADRIVAPSSSVSCGGRLDEVVLPGPEAVVARDCERTRAARSLVALTSRWKVAGGVFSLPLRSRERCRAQVSLFDGPTPLGTTRVRLPRGKERVARVPLSHSGLARVEISGCGPLLAFSLQL